MRAQAGVLLAIPALFTRGDGRERVAVPFWNGILSSLAAFAISGVSIFVVTIVLVIGVVLATGRMPSVNPGHPLLAISGAAGYAFGGWFAWWRLRAMGRRPFRRLTAADARTILIGVGVLVLVRIGLGIQLVLTHQTKHVQSGFEHFDVVTKVPAITVAGIVIGVATLVVIAPVVEEILFRGLLFGALARPLGVLAAAVITAALFGAAHGDWILFPTLAALGLVNAIAYAATSNLWVPVTLHALNNALGAVFLVASSIRGH